MGTRFSVTERKPLRGGSAKRSDHRHLPVLGSKRAPHCTKMYMEPTQLNYFCNHRTGPNWPCPVSNQIPTYFSEITEQGHKSCSRTHAQKRFHYRMTCQCHRVEIHCRPHTKSPNSDMQCMKSCDPLVPVH